ncbi:hypothetical protein EI94DRAFT_1697334 [Lactarius quietus]|nr:hypothetical protein EI94DRAFT_1697334 [Lactarius quietus]
MAVTTVFTVAIVCHHAFIQLATTAFIVVQLSSALALAAFIFIAQLIVIVVAQLVVCDRRMTEEDKNSPFGVLVPLTPFVSLNHIWSPMIPPLHTIPFPNPDQHHKAQQHDNSGNGHWLPLTTSQQ